MSPDDVIALRRTWDLHDYGPGDFPEDTILATSDWLAYVSAMADAIPDGPTIEFPTEEEVRWAWPDGVVIVLDHPIDAEHVVLSHTDAAGVVTEDEPYFEHQLMRAIVVGPETSVQPTGPGGFPYFHPDGSPVLLDARNVRYIDEDPGAYFGGWMRFGGERQSTSNLDHIGGVGRFLLATVVALGHRLTATSMPGGSRAERRRVDRELPSLRIIDLASGAATESRGGSVAWTHRWMVHGHWRDQPCGPGRTSRRVIWIDDYIKGPADKPLDVRPTIWETKL